MRTGWNLLASALLLLAVLGLTACSGDTQEDDQSAQLDEEWSWLTQEQDELADYRQQLRELRDRVEEASEEDLAELHRELLDLKADLTGVEAAVEQSVEGEDAEPPVMEDIEKTVGSIRNEIADRTDAWGQRLSQFINQQQITVGSERTETQSKAIRMKSDLDMIYAQEYIDEGGDYQRAIDIYGQALTFDPDNETLIVAKQRAEEMRYMTEERIAEVKVGMSRQEVREILGQPKPTNVRDFDNGIVGWFYPQEDGNASAVYFREEKGDMQVYEAKFNAVQRDQEES